MDAGELLADRGGVLDLSSFPTVRKGNKFEDFEVGQVLEHHWGRTLTQADNSLFCAATGNWNPAHLNADFARAVGHADVVVNPMLVLCTAVGLSVEDLSEAGGPFLGLDNCLFHQPVHPNDTIVAQSTVMSARGSSKFPHSGVVTWHTVVHNQRDELVVEFDRTNLVAKRERT